uniref:ribosomal protein L29 n=1 Tax=Campylaephora boydenii TaxID=202204 RepID=UPI002551F978|nr:ribosomal protein L29 [Campylaephora boydenii]WGT74202.1 ribosomal protein L29 [Campylaephora boydenii]
MTTIKKDEWQGLTIDIIRQNIIKIKKDIVIMQIDKKTKQTIKPHEIKKKQHELAQLLTLETLKIKS